MKNFIKIFVFLAISFSVWTLNRIGFYHFSPTGNLMLSRERVFLYGEFSPDFGVDSFLEKRYFSDIYRENHFLLIPKISWEFFKIGVGYYFQNLEIPELNYSKKIHEKALKLEINQPTFFANFYYISPELYSAELAFLNKIAIPVEFNLKYQRKLHYFEGLIFSTLVYLKNISGFGVGYEVEAKGLHFLAWLYPIEKIRVRSEFYLASKLRPQNAISFSVEYFFGKTFTKQSQIPKKADAEQENLKSEQKKTLAEEEQAFDKQAHSQKNTSYQKPPTFPELIRLGVSAEEALKISQAQNLCVAKKETLVLLGERGKLCH